MILCRALRQLGRRPCPFLSSQMVHDEGNCWARIVLPREEGQLRVTVTAYGANEREACDKMVLTSLTILSSEAEGADRTVLRLLPTDDTTDLWRQRHERLEVRPDAPILQACMEYAREMRGMHSRAEDRSRIYLQRCGEAEARVEDLEAQVAQLQQHLAGYGHPPAAPQPAQDEDSSDSEPEEIEGESSVSDGRSGI